MLAFRVIARLDIRNEHVIQRIRCEGVRKVGDPAELAGRYDRQGADELIYLDTVSSLYGRPSIGPHIRVAAQNTFTPLCAGGGVGSLDVAKSLFEKDGADKVAINTAAVRRPEILHEISRKYGSQAIVLQLDAKRRNGSWEAYCEGARQPTGRDAIEWAKEAVDRGAGEILVTSIDNQGTRAGFDLELLERLSSFPVPVVVSGGFGAPHHAVEAWRAGVSGIAISGVLHHNKVSIEDIKRALRESGAAVRTNHSL